MRYDEAISREQLFLIINQTFFFFFFFSSEITFLLLIMDQRATLEIRQCIEREFVQLSKKTSTNKKEDKVKNHINGRKCINLLGSCNGSTLPRYLH